MICLIRAGIGIISAIETAYGYWEYKCAGSQVWTKLNFTYQPPLTTAAYVNMVLLTPDDYMRFTLNGSKYWKFVDADKRKISFQAVAWDQTDNKTCGNFTFNNSTEPWPESFSERNQIVTAFQLRKGCNGKATDAVFDLCNVCGGDGSSCKGCDGVVNSTARTGMCVIDWGPVFPE